MKTGAKFSRSVLFCKRSWVKELCLSWFSQSKMALARALKLTDWLKLWKSIAGLVSRITNNKEITRARLKSLEITRSGWEGCWISWKPGELKINIIWFSTILRRRDERTYQLKNACLKKIAIPKCLFRYPRNPKAWNQITTRCTLRALNSQSINQPRRYLGIPWKFSILLSTVYLKILKESQ